MALVKGICKNYGECDLADNKEVQEVDKTNFVCEECGKPLHLPDSTKKTKGKRPNNKLMIIIAAIVVLLALIGGFFVLGKGETKPDPESTAVLPVDSDNIKAEQHRADSIEAAQIAAEQQRIKDSLDAAAKTDEQKKNESKPIVSQPDPVSSGTIDLGYAIFKGTLKNGKPDAVNGRLIFKVAHQIDSRDSKQRMAEAGDYIIGEFSEGHLVQGIWYGADNQVKGSVIIGR